MEGYFQDKANAIEAVDQILAIEGKNAAQEFFLEFVQKFRAKSHGMESALSMARFAVGWCFGAGMTQERADMWHNATGAEHRVFGKTVPDDLNALMMGYRIGREECKKKNPSKSSESSPS